MVVPWSVGATSAVNNFANNKYTVSFMRKLWDFSAERACDVVRVYSLHYKSTVGRSSSMN